MPPETALAAIEHAFDADGCGCTAEQTHPPVSHFPHGVRVTRSKISVSAAYTRMSPFFRFELTNPDSRSSTKDKLKRVLVLLRLWHKLYLQNKIDVRDICCCFLTETRRGYPPQKNTSAVYLAPPCAPWAANGRRVSCSGKMAWRGWRYNERPPACLTSSSSPREAATR